MAKTYPYVVKTGPLYFTGRTLGHCGWTDSIVDARVFRSWSDAFRCRSQGLAARVAIAGPLKPVLKRITLTMEDGIQ